MDVSDRVRKTYKERSNYKSFCMKFDCLNREVSCAECYRHDKYVKNTKQGGKK